MVTRMPSDSSSVFPPIEVSSRSGGRSAGAATSRVHAAMPCAGQYPFGSSQMPQSTYLQLVTKYQGARPVWRSFGPTGATVRFRSVAESEAQR